ncbi:MAG TPA: LEPR-XLL domain-containing protein [Tepidisphaeraceae bacterium]|nr:LEPR-XLL domain-containing protein [Tepidisphaeraceae bacterium]
MKFLEPLESRILMSATPGQIAATLKQAKTDEAKISADVAAINSQLNKAAGTMKGDLSKLGVLKTDASLEGAGLAAAKAFVNSMKSDIKFYAPEFNKDAAKLVSDEKKFAKSPGNTSLQTMLRADFAAFSAISFEGINPFTFNSMAPAVDSALDAIVAANPTGTKLASDVATIKSNLATRVTKVQNDAVMFFDTDDGNLQGLFPYPN